MRDVHVVLVPDVRMQAIDSRSTKDPSSLKCDLCSKTFTRSWLLKNHQRIHTGEKPYQCSYCEKAFSDKSNLRQHLKIHTTTEKLFQCGMCQRTFAQRRYLVKHATEIHRVSTLSLESDKKTKYTEPVKTPVKKISVPKVTPIAVPVLPDIINRSADHQYLTRQKSKTKTTPDSKDDQEQKDIRKYSEQDLKDFIKSNQKTMEKNGYIFIKQNFESLDTEPTLTEISEVPVTAVADDIALKTDTETGNQLLNVNGKMVYLHMENKPVVLPHAMKTVPATNMLTTDTASQSMVTNTMKGRKLVMKKEVGPRRLANILKSGGIKKLADNHNVMVNPPKQHVTIPNVTKPLMMSGNQPTQYLQRLSNNEPFTLVPVLSNMSGGTIPVVQNNTSTFIVPVSMFQVPQQAQQIMVAPQNTITPVSSTIPIIPQNPVTLTEENLNVNVEHTTSSDQQVIEVQPITVNIDEKGAANDLICAQSSVQTPIVSDAPWQGIVNINSEQELLEYINSQSTSAIESDQGMTILIQNVDNGAVMSLDSQTILSGSTNISSVFQDQSTILSDVLPVSGNITEVQVQTDGSADVCLDTNVAEKIDCESSEYNKTEEQIQAEMDIVKEEANDSDDAPSQVMLTEANREHLSDQDDDFSGDHDEKMLIKTDPDEFNDHTMYTANEKCEMDDKADIMESDETTAMVIDVPCTNTDIGNCHDYKDET